MVVITRCQSLCDSYSFACLNFLREYSDNSVCSNVMFMLLLNTNSIGENVRIENVRPLVPEVVADEVAVERLNRNRNLWREAGL